MKGKSILTILAATFGCFCVFAMIGGCDRTNDKRCRLMTDENMQMKKDIERLNKELELRDEDIKKQKEQIESCLKDKKSIEEVSQQIGGNASQQAFSEDANDIVGLLIEENTALKEELEKLKSQIAEPNKQPENKPSQ